MIFGRTFRFRFSTKTRSSRQPVLLGFPTLVAPRKAAARWSAPLSSLSFPQKHFVRTMSPSRSRRPRATPSPSTSIFPPSVSLALAPLSSLCSLSSRLLNEFSVRSNQVSEPRTHSSGTPMQRYRSVHGVDHRRASASGFQQVRLQPEIPLGGPVRIVNQHQTRVVLQTFGLQDHRFLVLSQELPREDAKNRHRQEQIPGSHEINPAKIALDGRDRRPARKPQLPAANFFRADIRQQKIDRGRHWFAGDFPQHPVRRAVRARRVRAHAESVGNWLEFFFFFVNAAPASPVPRLVNERPMRRIHQSDDALVHMRRQLTIEMCYAVFVAENRQLRRRRSGLSLSRSRCIHVHPKITITFFAKIVAGENSLHFQFVLARQRWDFDALTAARFKPPAVIAALDCSPVETPVRQRNSTVRARIPHRKRFSLRRASQHQRHFQQRRGRQRVPAHCAAPQRRIPEIPKKSRVTLGRSLSLLGSSLQNRPHCFAHYRFHSGCFVACRLREIARCRFAVYLVNMVQLCDSGRAHSESVISNQAQSRTRKILQR